MLRCLQSMRHVSWLEYVIINFFRKFRYFAYRQLHGVLTIFLQLGLNLGLCISKILEAYTKTLNLSCRRASGHVQKPRYGHLKCLRNFRVRKKFHIFGCFLFLDASWDITYYCEKFQRLTPNSFRVYQGHTQRHTATHTHIQI